ncbi:hypothetical protein GC170_13445 [bacterium]|nr:hypothetical protein [bacterium]
MNWPFLTDIACRLACGLVLWSAVIEWRPIPVAFFRTQCMIALGLFVLGLLAGWSDMPMPVRGIWIGLALASYFASICWGIGLPKFGRGLCALMALVSLGMLGWGGYEALGPIEAAARMAGAAWLGATLTAMLLGHYYLTAPAMSIAPLSILIRGMFLGLGLRAVTTLAPFVLGQTSGGMNLDAFSALWLGMRVVMGYAGTFLATYLAWRTAAIRSTQSATGILYIALALLLFGELTAMLLGRSWGMTV